MVDGGWLTHALLCAPMGLQERRWNELMVRPRAVARRIFTIPMAFQRGQAMQRENPVAPVQPLVRDEGL